MMSRRVPEYHDTSSDGEDILYDPIVPDYRSWDRRKTNYAALNLNQKYKTLEPRSKSGGDAHSLERLNPPRSGPARVLPDVPSHSLPRQGKRTQSDSRSRDRGEAEAGAESVSGSFGRVSSKETQDDTHLVMVAKKPNKLTITS